MKRNKKNILTFGIVAGIIISLLFVIKLISYGSMILPQLFELKEDQYKMPELCSDEEVIKLLNNNNGKDMVELYKLGNELFEQEKYKEAYNIYKLATESNNDYEFPLDLSFDASLNIEMSKCYHMILNNKQSCYFADLALDKMPNEAEEFDIYYTYYHAALAYSDKEIDEGFSESHETIQLFEKVLNLKTEDVTRQQFYVDSKKQITSWIKELYGFSPSVYDKEMEIKYYKKALELEATDVSLYYGMAIAYLEFGDIQKAKEYRDLTKKNDVNKIDNYVLSAYFHIVNGDMKEAEKYLNKLKYVAVSHTNKDRFYYISTLYYQKLGDKEKATEYLTKFVELSNYEVYTYQVIELEKSLDINFDYIREKLAKEREKNYSVSLEVEGY